MIGECSDDSLLRLTRSKRLSGRIFTSLKDKGAVAQVDETRSRAFLQQGLTAEAEKAADSSVRTLEKSDLQAELAESLTTHGRALARLENYGMALTAFRRAVRLSRKVGSLNRAAEAAFIFRARDEEQLLRGLITGTARILAPTTRLSQTLQPLGSSPLSRSPKSDNVPVCKPGHRPAQVASGKNTKPRR